MSKANRLARIFVFTVVLYVLPQVIAQIAMEVTFPFAVKVGPFTAVLFNQ